MIKDLYPFSTQDGAVIPLDIVRPLSCLRVPFVTGSASAQVDLGETTPVLVLRGATNCFISFGGTAVVPGTTPVADLFFFEANTIVVVAPKSSLVTVIGDTAAGDLDIQLVERWAGLGSEAKYAIL